MLDRKIRSMSIPEYETGIFPIKLIENTNALPKGRAIAGVEFEVGQH